MIARFVAPTRGLWFGGVLSINLEGKALANHEQGGLNGRQGPPAKGRFLGQVRFSGVHDNAQRLRVRGGRFNFQGLALGSLRHSRRGEREGVSGGAVRRI
jgi:hypothetical protein